VQQAKAAVPKPNFGQLLLEGKFVQLLQGYDVVIMSYEEFAVGGSHQIANDWQLCGHGHGNQD
jgi:hypothetical protein